MEDIGDPRSRDPWYEVNPHIGITSAD